MSESLFNCYTYISFCNEHLTRDQIYHPVIAMQCTNDFIQAFQHYYKYLCDHVLLYVALHVYTSIRETEKALFQDWGALSFKFFIV